MNETPNFLIRLGEALGPVGSLVFLLLLCGGAVWVVMAIRRSRDDHARIEKKVDAGFERLEKKIDAVVEHLEGKIDVGVECVGGKIESSRKATREESKEVRAAVQGLRKESREDAQEIREMIRAINRRLDRIIDGRPPNQPG